MGKIAESLADVVIVTDDNPRSEDPNTIRQEIIEGLSNQLAAQNIADRACAIRHAIQSAKLEDVVVIAGKGHERNCPRSLRVGL